MPVNLPYIHLNFSLVVLDFVFSSRFDFACCQCLSSVKRISVVNMEDDLLTTDEECHIRMWNRKRNIKAIKAKVKENGGSNAD